MWLLAWVPIVFCGCSRSPEEQPVGRDSTWFPHRFGIYTANINGFLNELVDEMQQELNLSLVDQDWIHLFENLDDGKTLGAFTAIVPTSELLTKYSFSEPVLLTGPVLVIAADTPYQTIHDLKGKMVGVYSFDRSVLIAQDVPDVIIKPYQHVPVALEELASHRYDALLAPVIEATALVNTTYKGRLRIISEPLNSDGIRLMVLRGQEDNLLDVFNMELLQRMRSGKYQMIKRRYRLP